MANRVERVQKLVELAEMESDKAAQTLALLQEQHATAVEQYNALLGYEQEYAQNPVSQTSITPIQLQTHFTFGEKLNQALFAQVKQVEESNKMADLAQEAWIEKHTRVKALQALLKKIEKSQVAEFNKQEQKLTDELALQKSLINNSSF
jgi:flagellar FliJ protein